MTVLSTVARSIRAWIAATRTARDVPGRVGGRVLDGLDQDRDGRRPRADLGHHQRGRITEVVVVGFEGLRGEGPDPLAGPVSLLGDPARASKTRPG